MKTLVIAGYSGIGKSTFIERCARDVMDYDDPCFPKDVEDIVDYIKIMDGNVKYVTLLPDIDIMRCLVNNDIDFHVVLPDTRRM